MLELFVRRNRNLKARSLESLKNIVVGQAKKEKPGEDVAECFPSWLKPQQTTSYNE